MFKAIKLFCKENKVRRYPAPSHLVKKHDTFFFFLMKASLSNINQLARIIFNLTLDLFNGETFKSLQ